MQDCRCGLCGGGERENPPQGVPAGGGSERLQPWRKSWRQSLLQIFVCRNVFRRRPAIGCTLEPFALFLVQRPSSECRGSTRSNQLRGRGAPCGPGPVLTWAGWRPVCGGGAANASLFQRDLFTVCFSPALCAAFWATDEDSGASQCHKSPQFSFWLTDITPLTRSLANCGCAHQLTSWLLCVVMRISKWHFPLMN